MELQPIHSKEKGSKAKVISTYDAKFRTHFDRKITEWAMHPMAAAVAAFLKSLALEPPIQTGTPDP